MKPQDFSENAPGQLVTVERPRTRDEYDAPEHHADRPTHIPAFSPNALPPAFTIDAQTAMSLTQATFALGRLDGRAGAAVNLPNPEILLRPLQRREAIESSRIEGSMADLDDLVVAEARPKSEPRTQDIIEASNYVEALRRGLNEVEDRGIAVGLIRELQAQLFYGTNASFKPGEFRSRPLVIGQRNVRAEEARFVPSPPDMIGGQIDDLVRFISEPSKFPALIKVAMVHYQFETIHPFPDGNGRVGRMLIPIMLRQERLLNRGTIDISAYIARNRDVYINALYDVSTKGAWKDWVCFFLTAIEEQATDAVHRFDALVTLRLRYIQRVREDLRLPMATEVVDHLIEQTSITAKELGSITAVSASTAGRYLDALLNANIIAAADDRKRDRVFIAREILGVLDSRASNDL